MPDCMEKLILNYPTYFLLLIWLECLDKIVVIYCQWSNLSNGGAPKVIVNKDRWHWGMNLKLKYHLCTSLHFASNETGS